MNAVELTQEMVHIESTNPGTYEKELSAYVFDWLKKTGAKVEKQKVFADRYNIIATLDGAIQDPALVFICHMDTVPVGEGWKYDPLGANIIDGKMYGRGACDMKCGLAACMIAFATIAEAKQKITHTFKMVATVDEEDCMFGVQKLLEAKIVNKNTWMLDSEPTGMEIQVAHKGKTWFIITAYGCAVHSSTPELGVDAVSAMGEFISALNKKVANCPVHKEMGHCGVTYGIIKGGINTNIVPDNCQLTIDFRLVPPVTNDDSIQMVQEAMQKATELVKGSKFSLKITSAHQAVDRDESSFLLGELKKAVKEVEGKEAVINYFPGYTDTAVVAAHTGNINCMSYGPANLAQAHKPNEYVECAKIERATQVIIKLAENILLA